MTNGAVDRRLARYAPVVIAVVAGIGALVSLTAFSVFMDEERHHFRRLAESQVDAHAKVLQHGIEMHVQALASFKGFFAAQGAVDRRSFAAFVRNGGSELESIRGVTWNPRVTAGDRAAFERAARAEGLTRFRITRRTADGGIEPSPPRDVCFPAMYSEPGNRAAPVGAAERVHADAILGLDTWSRPRLRKAMEMARDRGEPVATGLHDHLAVGGAPSGILVFQPIYRGGTTPNSVDGRRRDLTGFVTAAMDVGAMVESVLRRATIAAGLDIYIYGEAEGGMGERLYVHLSRVRDGAVAPLDDDLVREGLHWARTLDVAGRRWTAVFRLAPSAIAAQSFGTAWVILGVALLLTAVAVVFMLISRRRLREIEMLLYQVTEANDRLGRELTERSAAERKFRKLLDSAPDATVICSAGGDIVLANDQAVTLFGYAQDELVGQKIEILIPERFHGGHEGHRTDFFRSGIVRPMGQGLELVGLAKDGREFPIEISLGPIETGAESLVTAAVRDITDRKAYMDEINNRARDHAESQTRRLEETNAELMKARDDAKAADKAKSEFLTMMSHELRTPLNAIIGFSGIMNSEAAGQLGDPKYREYAAAIHDSGQHLLEVIEDILDLTKVESGSIALDEKDIDMRALLDGTVRLHHERALAAGVTLECDRPDDLPGLRGDPRKVKQMLASLLSNAIKFTERGGRVSVSAWCSKDSDYTVQVTDTGIGIALDDIPKALAAFSQVDSDLNRRYEGTGRGLPLTRSLVELHGGTFDLQSKPGVGTTVTIRFPAERVIGPMQNISALAG